MRYSFVAVALTVLSATAYAQAPGDYDAGPPSGPMPVVDAGLPPSAVPVVVVVPVHESVMANRWAVGLSLGGMTLQHSGTNEPSKFNIGELALRFRATLHLELEATLAGGSEKQDGGDQVSGFALTARYRFQPEHRWNWWLSGGVGVLGVVPDGATDQEKSDATREELHAGIGLERRFHRFALQAELRAIVTGPSKGESDGTTTTMPTAGRTPASMPPPNDPSTTPNGESGAQLTIGGSFYF